MPEPLLSIITCDAKALDTPILRGSVERYFGSGASYELVSTIEAPSIARGYNRGAERAKASSLLFVHSDVKIMAGWPLIAEALEILGDPKTGVMGVAGSRTLLRDPVWWQSGNISGACMHTNGEATWMNTYGQGNCGIYGRVVVLDGVFLLVSRRVFNKVGGFDESFPGWDFYDLDLTLRAHLAGCQNSTFPFPIVHHSIGDTTGKDSWHANRERFAKKWAAKLPVSL